MSWTKVKDFNVSVTYENESHLDILTFDGKKLEACQTIQFKSKVLNSAFKDGNLWVLTTDSPNLHLYECKDGKWVSKDEKFVQTINEKIKFQFDETKLNRDQMKKRKNENPNVKTDNYFIKPKKQKEQK